MKRRHNHTGPAGNYFRQAVQAERAQTYALARLQREAREQNKDVHISETHDEVGISGGDAMWAGARMAQLISEFNSGGSNA